MTEAEWQELLEQMQAQENFVRAWEPALPEPLAPRCVHSRHRTLAHLRACQETWLAAGVAFRDRPNPRLKLLHPWRLFEQNRYELVPWEEHLEAFLEDRFRWKTMLATGDRSRGGKLNEKPHTIEGLTSRLVEHERYHLFEPR